MNANEQLLDSIERPLREIVTLIRATSDGRVSPQSMRQRLSSSILSIQWAPSEHGAIAPQDLARYVKGALCALADEVSSRPGSRCNYSEHHELLLLQQEHMHTDNAGELFFTDLSSLLDTASGDQAKTAVVSVYALCLALGFRGIYAGHGLQGYEELHSRVLSCVRPILSSTVVLPDIPAPQWPRPRAIKSAWFHLVLIAMSTAVVAALVTLHASLKNEAESVVDALSNFSYEHQK